MLCHSYSLQRRRPEVTQDLELLGTYVLQNLFYACPIELMLDHRSPIAERAGASGDGLFVSNQKKICSTSSYLV